MLEIPINVPGIPAVMVSINFGIDLKAFNGEYVLISEENKTCSFR